MAKSKSELDAILTEIDRLVALATGTVAALPAGRKLQTARLQLMTAATALREASEQLDPVLRPESVFDPTDPNTAGRVVALTMVAQDRHPLAAVPAFYGAGVYAIYYNGPFDAYAPLRGREHPIYVGKADPDSLAAKEPVEQGTKLSGRLREHAKSILAASSSLDIAHFECRFLIVQTGFQKSAEDYLIQFFKPIWNSETKICFGLGKHGDSSETRGNKRSPWDTMHPGRAWATSSTENQKEEATIRQQIAAHLQQYAPYADFQAIFDTFVRDMRQLSAERFKVPGEPGTLSTSEAFGENESGVTPDAAK